MSVSVTIGEWVKISQNFVDVTCGWSLDELEHDAEFLLGLGVEEAILDDLDGEGAAAGGAVQGEVGEHVDGASAVVGVLKWWGNCIVTWCRLDLEPHGTFESFN